MKKKYIFYLVLILLIIMFYNLNKDYKCYLNNEVCVEELIYNNYYYGIFENKTDKKYFDIINKNSFIIDLKEISGRLYILVQESKKPILDNKIIETCQKIKEPFKFQDDEYYLRVYQAKNNGNEYYLQPIPNKAIPEKLKDWYSSYHVNEELVFIC